MDSPWESIVIPVLTTALTLMGTGWQAAEQNRRADQVRFIDGAHTTAQETSKLLDEGYEALSKLVNQDREIGWKDISKSGWHEYREFYRHWRRQLIAKHFELTRYFGKDIADQLIHLDEIDIQPVDNLNKADVCAPAGTKDSFDLAKLARQTECVATMRALTQDDINNLENTKATEGFFDLLQAERRQRDFSQELLEHYDKSTVTYLRTLDSTLTKLGEPQVTIVVKN